MTHSQPDNSETVFELPPAVKRQLGLDAERSWVILDKVNEFAWPGFDLRPVLRAPERFAYGFLPQSLFDQMIAKPTGVWSQGLGKTVPRD